MLGKLIKYDLKAMGKTIIPFWAALLISGWLLAIQNQFSSIGKFSTMNVIVVLICIVVITAVLVMNVVIIIQRFWNGLLKEEGYLMFTLPVSSRGLIFSKLISAMLISLGTGIVIILMFLPWIFLEEVHFEDIRTIMNAINLSIVKWSVYGIVLCIAEVANGIYHIYAAMAIGQLSNKNRFVFSVVAYILISIVFGMLFVPIMNIASTAAGSEWMYLAMDIVEIIIFHIITEYILTKKLNLE